MKKENVLKQLEQLEFESDQKPADDLGQMPMQIIAVLLAYINDPQILLAVDKIQF